MISRMQISRPALCPVGFDKHTRHQYNACLVCSFLDRLFLLSYVYSTISYLHVTSIFMPLSPPHHHLSNTLLCGWHHVCMYVCRRHLYPSPHTCGGQRAALWSSFSPSTFTRVLRIETTQLAQQASVCAEHLNHWAVSLVLRLHSYPLQFSLCTGNFYSLFFLTQILYLWPIFS